VNDEAWGAVERHFDALRELTADQQAAGLAVITDKEVRREVASLLENAGNGGTVTAVVGSAAARLESSVPDERLGPYRIVRRLGQGGQGAVFEAVRDDGRFHQRVAIKIVKWEIDNETTRRRFRDERQILAGLEHPYIARLLDGGETRDGAPYLVMEFVDGQPLIEATEGWTTRRKLELFLKVAEAVAAAHRKLIVHRDLKPANILVTGEGNPKLLDFGIAKLLDTGVEQTQTLVHSLTPQYASPEQVRGEQISTASDVYSMGVVLYQLLTGRKPYKLETSTPLEMDRVICQQPPEPAGLNGELDAILAMALRKEPERRYQGVEPFAEDIRRYLEGLPVLARPDTISYRARKYGRRHWVGLVAAALAFGGVVGGAAVAVYQARIAQQRFQQVRSLARSFVFDYQDELAKVDGNTAVREKMVRTALQYLDTLSRSAASDLELQKELAAAYQRVGDTQGFPTAPNLGHTQDAIASYRKGAAIYEAVALREPEFRGELGRFYTDFAYLLRYAHNYPDAIRMAETALHSEEQRARARPDDEAAQVRLANAWALVADIDEDRGYYKRALIKNRSGEAVARAILGRWRNSEALSRAEGAVERVGSTAVGSGYITEALQAFDEEERLLGELRNLEPRNPRHARNTALLAEFRADVYDDDLKPSLEDPSKCLVYSRQYLESARQMARADPNNASARFSVATALFRLSFPLKHFDPAGAVAAAQDSVRRYDEEISSGRSSFLVESRRGRALRRLAEALLWAGRIPEARAAVNEALSAQRKAAAHDREDLLEASLLASVLLTSAECADRIGDRAAALPYLTEAEQIAAAVFSKSPEEVSSLLILARTREALSSHWKRAGDQAQARRWLAESDRLWREFPDQNEFVRRKVSQIDARGAG
jgi:tRNA A-37 threonylcarbamoyl transferase component Bud32/tetratricopeptide (TPR) repeat protein